MELLEELTQEEKEAIEGGKRSIWDFFELVYGGLIGGPIGALAAYEA